MKSLRLPSEDKFLNSFNERLVESERKAHITTEEENPDIKKARKCAELRHERIIKLKEKYGDDIVAEAWADDGITQFELDWELECALRVPPEIRYQRRKEQWNGHESSWTARGVKTGYDGYGCNQFTGCISECQYFPDFGIIGDKEVIKEHNEKWARVKRYYDWERRILNLPREERLKLNSIICKKQEEYGFLTQHGGGSMEEYNAIRTTICNDYFDNKNKNNKNIEQGQQT